MQIRDADLAIRSSDPVVDPEHSAHIPQVRNATSPILDTILVHVDGAALIHPFSTCALYSNPKVRD